MPEKRTEYQRFEDMAKVLMSVPHSEIKKKLEEEKKAKAARKKEKTKNT
jgi:hypothetical protein